MNPLPAMAVVWNGAVVVIATVDLSKTQWFSTDNVESLYCTQCTYTNNDCDCQYKYTDMIKSETHS